MSSHEPAQDQPRTDAHTTSTLGGENGSPTPPDATVPGYEILGELGRGGMGVVYKARDLKLDRVVAVKMVLAGAHASEKELHRFLTEAQAAAGLQHPHIAQVHDIGRHGSLSYFTLEYVPGGSLAARLAGQPQPAGDAARLVEVLARAVEQAHRHGVVHRDLNPANVLLVEDSATPLGRCTPKITDFGLAKQLLGGTGRTQSGTVLGTPSYMPPEQAAGRTGQVAPSADVYALGAILYEMLTGRPPFRAANQAETLLQVLSDEPVLVRQLQPRTPIDLVTIAHKCLQKDPARRYASAVELAEDLRRFQAGEPIRARPVSRLERGWRWCRRNPAVASLLLAVFLSLGLGATLATVLGLEARRHADAAEDQARQARRAEERAEEWALQEEAAKKQARAETERADRNLYHSQIALALREWEHSHVALARYVLDATRADLRGWEYGYVYGLAHNPEQTLIGHTGDVRSVCFSPDGKRLVSGSEDQTVKIWDAQTGLEVLSLRGHTSRVWSVAISPDGKRIVSGGGDYSRGGQVKVWDAQTGREVLSFQGHTGIVRGVDFSPDGKHIVSGSMEQHTPGEMKLWDAHTGQELLSLSGHTSGISCVRFSPDGKLVVTGSQDSTVKVWDLHTGQDLFSFKEHTGPVTSVAFSPDGKRIASGSQDRTVTVWEAQFGHERVVFRAHTSRIQAVVFSSDGQRIASGGDEALLLFTLSVGSAWAVVLRWIPPVL